jgi:predicted RNA-binding Zn ribbon-like protein
MDPPAATELVLAFCNTHAGGRPDELGDGDGLRAWLRAAGFGSLEATGADAASARELRDAIQVVLLAHAGSEDGALAGAEAYLERIAARYPVVCVVAARGASLRPAQDGVPGAFTAVLAAIAEVAQTGAWARVKACRNPPCRFAFFDTTRNASATYHSAQCRSMVSMRAYRERRKATG